MRDIVTNCLEPPEASKNQESLNYNIALKSLLPIDSLFPDDTTIGIGFKHVLSLLFKMNIVLIVDEKGLFFLGDTVPFIYLNTRKTTAPDFVVFPITSRLCILLYRAKFGFQIGINCPSNRFLNCSDNMRKFIHYCVLKSTCNQLFSDHQFSETQKKYISNFLDFGK